jgi:hypothetical protein
MFFTENPPALNHLCSQAGPQRYPSRLHSGQ